MDNASMPDTRIRLALYSPDCKKCKHLDSEEEVAFEKCHHSKGNKHCPAQGVQIVIVGRAYRLAAKVRAARDRRDPQAEARIMRIVSRQTPAFQERFYNSIENPSETSSED